MPTDTDKIPVPFGNWSKSIQARLNFEYESSHSVLDHSTILGTIREGVVRDILSKFLPKTAEIGTGQVVDFAGTLSKQTDIVICRGSAPVFRFEGGQSAFLKESTLAVIEVKSMIYQVELIKSLENIASVKQLQTRLHCKAKGVTLFDEALKWVDAKGGLAAVEASMSGSMACPDDIWEILHFVRFWLHWANGDYGDFTKAVHLLAARRVLSSTFFVQC